MGSPTTSIIHHPHHPSDHHPSSITIIHHPSSTSSIMQPSPSAACPSIRMYNDFYIPPPIPPSNHSSLSIDHPSSSIIHHSSSTSPPSQNNSWLQQKQKRDIERERQRNEQKKLAKLKKQGLEIEDGAGRGPPLATGRLPLWREGSQSSSQSISLSNSLPISQSMSQSPSQSPPPPNKTRLRGSSDSSVRSSAFAPARPEHSSGGRNTVLSSRHIVDMYSDGPIPPPKESLTGTLQSQALTETQQSVAAEGKDDERRLRQQQDLFLKAQVSSHNYLFLLFFNNLEFYFIYI